MSDKTKQAARHIQRETGCTYTTALDIVVGFLRPIPRSPECSIARALSTMPKKLRERIPELGSRAEGKPDPRACTCAGCDP